MDHPDRKSRCSRQVGVCEVFRLFSVLRRYSVSEPLARSKESVRYGYNARIVILCGMSRTLHRRNNRIDIRNHAHGSGHREGVSPQAVKFPSACHATMCRPQVVRPAAPGARRKTKDERLAAKSARRSDPIL